MMILRKNTTRKQWENYASQFPNITSEYSFNTIEYRKEYSKYFVDDLSFILLENNYPIAIVPLFLELVNDDHSFSSAASYGVVPLINVLDPCSHKKPERILKEVMQIIENLAFEYRVRKMLFRFDPLVNPFYENHLYNYNFLMEYGFENTSVNSRVIDLRIANEYLWKNMRRSYKSIVNKAIREFDYYMYDAETITRNLFDIYREMHHKAAGRVTRPIITFDLMYEQILAGEALLFLAKFNEVPIATTFVSCYNKKAYYGSYADDSDADLPCSAGHGNQWFIMEKLRERGVECYEIGLQQFGKQTYDVPSQKEITISEFKRGFGGNTVSLYRGIKTF